MAHPLKNKPDLFLLNVSVKGFLLFLYLSIKTSLKIEDFKHIKKNKGNPQKLPILHHESMGKSMAIWCESKTDTRLKNYFEVATHKG